MSQWRSQSSLLPGHLVGVSPPHSRGVWGHAPPENFEILGALRCILGPSEAYYLALACQRKFIFSTKFHLDLDQPHPMKHLGKTKFSGQVNSIHIYIYIHTRFITEIFFCSCLKLQICPQLLQAIVDMKHCAL